MIRPEDRKELKRLVVEAEDFTKNIFRLKDDELDIVPCAIIDVSSATDPETGQRVVECHAFLPPQYNIAVKMTFHNMKQIKDFVIPIVISGRMAFNESTALE